MRARCAAQTEIIINVSAWARVVKVFLLILLVNFVSDRNKRFAVQNLVWMVVSMTAHLRTS